MFTDKVAVFEVIDAGFTLFSVFTDKVAVEVIDVGSFSLYEYLIVWVSFVNYRKQWLKAKIIVSARSICLNLILIN